MGIKKQRGGEAKYKNYALAGGAIGLFSRLTARVGVAGNKIALKWSPGANLVRNVAGAGLLGLNIANSYQHGKREKSFLAGVGRWATNTLAVGAGSVAGSLAGNVILKQASNAKYHVGKWRAAKDAATKAMHAAEGKPLRGSVIGKGGKKVRFVRIRGRVVPIRTEIG